MSTTVEAFGNAMVASSCGYVFYHLEQHNQTILNRQSFGGNFFSEYIGRTSVTLVNTLQIGAAMAVASQALGAIGSPVLMIQPIVRVSIASLGIFACCNMIDTPEDQSSEFVRRIRWIGRHIGPITDIIIIVSSIAIAYFSSSVLIPLFAVSLAFNLADRTKLISAPFNRFSFVATLILTGDPVCFMAAPFLAALRLSQWSQENVTQN